MTVSDPAPARPDARSRLLAAALDLFHAQGVPATSVEQILQASDTGKSQLYHYFGSKDGLVQAVVEEFVLRWRRGELPGRGPLRTVEDLEQWFRTFVEFQRTTGATRHCPMATIAAGLDGDQEATRLRIAELFAHARGVLERLFVALRDQGELTDDCDPRALADFCYAVMQGGLITSRIHRDVRPFENAVAHTMRHFRAQLRPA